MINKLKFVIDDPDRRRRFITAMKHYFKKEMNQETFLVGIKECDYIEFCFKDNGNIRFKRSDLEK